MTLTQSGSSVNGSYDWQGGQLSGTVSGTTLSGTWTEMPIVPPDPSDTGAFEFTMDASCQSFSGQWRYDFWDALGHGFGAC